MLSEQERKILRNTFATKKYFHRLTFDHDYRPQEPPPQPPPPQADVGGGGRMSDIVLNPPDLLEGPPGLKLKISKSIQSTNSPG